MSDYTHWHAGMKVVCIRENSCKDWGGYYAKCRYPIVGEVYTLRWIKAYETGEVGVLLMEIVNPVGDFKVGLAGETLFRAEQFRPVQERKSDISIFTAMLHDQRSKVPA